MMREVKEPTSFVRRQSGWQKTRSALPLLAVACLVAAAACASDGAGPDDSSRVRSNTTAEAGGAAEISETIEIGGAPFGVQATDDAVWVGNGEGSVTRIDPATNEIVATIVVGDQPTTGVEVVSATDDAVWVAAGSPETYFVRIDPSTNEIVASIQPPGPRVWPADATDDALWAASYSEATVTRFDSFTGEIAATIDVDSAPDGVAATRDGVWIIYFDEQSLTRIDPTTNGATEVAQVAADVKYLDATDDAIWVANDNENTVALIDPETYQSSEPIDIEAQPLGIAATADGAWVLLFGGGDGSDSVVYVDRDTSVVSDPIAVDGEHESSSMDATDDTLWVANYSNGTLTRIDDSAAG